MKVYETVQRFGGPIPQHEAEEMGISNGTRLFVMSREEFFIFLYRVRAHVAAAALPSSNKVLDDIAELLQEDYVSKESS